MSISACAKSPGRSAGVSAAAASAIARRERANGAYKA